MWGLQGKTMSRSSKLPYTICTNCAKVLDGASSIVGDHTPSPGDITVCIYCSHLMAYADDLTLREMTDAEMNEIAGNKKILTAMEVVAAFRKWKQRKKK